MKREDQEGRGKKRKQLKAERTKSLSSFLLASVRPSFRSLPFPAHSFLQELHGKGPLQWPDYLLFWTKAARTSEQRPGKGEERGERGVAEPPGKDWGPLPEERTLEGSNNLGKLATF